MARHFHGMEEAGVRFSLGPPKKIMEKEPSPNNEEKERLSELADELDRIQNEKTDGRGSVIMQKLIRLLRDGDAHMAKVFFNNEADKFNQYREDALPLIIEVLYGGSGSPWFSIERKLKDK
jgi:hypothetical protein